MIKRVEWFPFAFVGTIYASGFVVVTHFQSRLRLPSFDLLRVKYLVAGLYYTILTGTILAVVYLVAFYIAALPKYRSDPTAPGSSLPVSSIFSFTALTMFPVLVFFFSEPRRTSYVVTYFLLVYVVGLVGVVLLRLKAGVPTGPVERRRLEVTRWLLIGPIWFFGLDILISLGVVETVLIRGRFYVVFTTLLGLIIGLLPFFNRLARNFYRGDHLMLVGPPLLIAVLLYLSLVSFALTLYDRIPAVRGGGGLECITLELTDGSRDAGVLLDQRADGLYLASQIPEDGMIETIRLWDVKTVRQWTYRSAPPEQPYIGQGYARLFAAGARGWGHSIMELFTARTWLKECAAP